jgi:hypothetical protein
LLTAAKPKHRSIPRTRSGLELPRGVDGRRLLARRFRDLYEAYAAEVGGTLTEGEKGIIRQAVALQIQAEQMQEAIVRGEIIDADQLIRVSSTSKRILSAISARAAQSKPTGPDLHSYLSSRYGSSEPAEAVADVDESESMTDS